MSCNIMDDGVCCSQSKAVDSHQQLKRQFDEAKVRHELEVGTLTENLSTLRAEMSSSTQRLTELERTIRNLEGEKLGSLLKFCTNVHLLFLLR